MNWLKNTSGSKDSMFTFACIAFIVVTFRVILGTFTASWGDKSFMIQDMDAGLAAAYLGATFTAYWARRSTKSKKKGRK